ncbi:MAG: caspase family protein [Candidatus Competibacteraceae bacterium]
MKTCNNKKTGCYQKNSIFISQYWLITLVIAVLTTSFQVSAEPIPVVAESPYLRIEAFDHTAIINRMALDQEKTLLLTVSDDKTARLWNLPGGELRGVLRVPIDNGLEGAIYAGALSPDGKTAILAGSITNNENSFSIYLYDTANLRMKSRLSKLPSEILHVAYTPDGTRFAAAFGSAGGVIVWDSSSGKKVAEDLKYGAACNWIVFAGDGRMATSSDDGFIRIYNPKMQLLHQIKSSNGKEPYSLSFSEDGHLLAVGYKDKIKVEIIDTTLGKVVKTPSVDGLAGEELSSVAWSGGDLLAAGAAAKGDKRMIRRWPQSGGKPIDVPIAENAITSLSTLPNGAWLYATAEPSWGIVTPDGRFLMRHDSPIADFRNIFRHRFALSGDGLAVEWRLNSKQTARFRFNLTQPDQELTINPPPDAELTSPITNDAVLPVDKWQNTMTPVFKKSPITLGRNETSRSLAIAADHSGFVLGTDHYIRWFDAQGAELVKMDVPASAAGVNLSRDGRYLVAALADGALHWYRLHSAQPGRQASIEEYAGLFLSVDGVRWIAWTKEGFFAHSMNGGKNLAGYHLNRGSNKTPEWIDFGQLYQSFYSPSLLSRKMIGGQEATLQAQFAQAQEVVKRLFAEPVPEVEWVEYCLLEKTDTVTRAFRRVEPAPVATSATPAVTPTTTSTGTDSCSPIGKSTTRAFSRAQQPIPTTAAPVTTATAASEVKPEEPVLQTNDLPAGKRLVRLRFKLKERNGGVSEIQLLRNGVVVENANAKTRGFSRATTSPVANSAATPAKENTTKEGEVILERDLELDEGTNRLQVRAYDGRYSANGKSSIVSLVVPAVAAPVETATRGEKPTLHVLSVGVDKYREANNKLNFAVKDAKAVAELFEGNFSSADFGKVSVLRLYDEQATRSEIENAFGKIASQVEINPHNDTVVVYLAGHGMNDKDTYYFIPQNSLSEDFVQTAISQKWLGEKLAKISEYAKNILVFLDSCHSGAYDPKQSESISKARDSFGELLMIAAASAKEAATDEYKTPDGKSTNHGVFGYAVFTGLMGGEGAVNRYKKVTALRLVGFVQEEMMEISKQHAKYANQHPVAIPLGKDLTRLEFPLTTKK